MTDIVDAIQEKLDQHGELHIILAEHDGPKDLRRGMVNAYNDPVDGWIHVQTQDTDEYINTEHIVSFDEPRNF